MVRDRTYGRAKFGDVICENLPKQNTKKIPPVGRTKDVPLEGAIV